MNTNIKHTALLSRLSREDENIGTSESILTQKTMLTQYAKSHHFKNIIHYVDFSCILLRNDSKPNAVFGFYYNL